MWFEPRLRSYCEPRRALRPLWRQYFQYGWWRAVTVHKHRRVVSPRHLVPGALVAGLAGGPVLAAVAPPRPPPRRWPRGPPGSRPGRWSSRAAGWRERGGPPEVAARVPVAVACLHLAYGAGFWSGVAHLLARAARRG